LQYVGTAEFVQVMIVLLKMIDISLAIDAIAFQSGREFVLINLDRGY